MPIPRTAAAATALLSIAPTAIAQTPELPTEPGATSPIVISAEMTHNNEALGALRRHLEQQAGAILDLPFAASLTLSDTWATRQEWTLSTDANISEHLDAAGIGSPKDSFLQFIEWAKQVHARLVFLTEDGTRREGIDPHFDVEMDFELSIRAVIRSPDPLTPLAPEEMPVRIGGIESDLSQRQRERLHGGRRASVHFRGLDMTFASDGHEKIMAARMPPDGACLHVAVELDSDTLAYAQPLTGRVVVTNIGSRRVTLSPGDIVSCIGIKTEDGGDAPAEYWLDSQPIRLDWLSAIPLLPGESSTQPFSIETRSAPCNGYRLHAGRWMIDYRQGAYGDEYSLEWSPVYFTMTALTDTP